MIIERFTLPHILRNSCSTYSDRPSLNFVNTQNRTYRHLLKEVNSLAYYLLKSGVSKGDKIAIFSANMPNWGITQFAISLVGAITVPILPGFSTEEIKNILEHSETKIIFVSKLLYSKINDIKTDHLSKKILINDMSVIPDGCNDDCLDKIEEKIPMNIKENLPNIDVFEEDTASIIYTSGTTGFSKGVELTHKNIVWNAFQCNTIQLITTDDRFLSLLPMAHTYENTIGLLLPVMKGASVYYLDRAPTPKLLVPAMLKIKPTAMLSVPLIIEKIYRKQIQSKFTASKGMKFIYSIAPIRKLLNMIAGKKLMQTFGGHLKFFGIGGAKLDPVVEKFLKEARFPYAIGYGLTETSPMAAGSCPFKTVLSSTGTAMDGVQIKIDNPDKKGEGEICIKGPNVMKGYYKNPTLTSEVITEDGWFKTGDLGYINNNGVLSIRGRIKTMIIGATGENIYPEEIESVINNFRFVTESLVVEYKGKLVAMVHFNIDEIEKHITSLKEQAGSYIEELKNELRDYVNSRVNNFSKLQLVLIQHEPFEKTPTQKIKRFLYNKINNL